MIRMTDHPGSTPLQTTVAQWAAAGWRIEAQTPRQAVMTTQTRCNHVLHGLLLAGMVIIGGPIAFCLGVGGAVGNEAEGIEPNSGALIGTLGLWLVVVVLQGIVWAHAAKPTVTRKVLTQDEQGAVTVVG